MSIEYKTGKDWIDLTIGRCRITWYKPERFLDFQCGYLQVCFFLRPSYWVWGCEKEIPWEGETWYYLSAGPLFIGWD